MRHPSNISTDPLNPRKLRESLFAGSTYAAVKTSVVESWPRVTLWRGERAHAMIFGALASGPRRERPGGRRDLVTRCCPTPFKDGLGLVRGRQALRLRTHRCAASGLDRASDPSRAGIHVGNGVCGRRSASGPQMMQGRDRATRLTQEALPFI